MLDFYLIVSDYRAAYAKRWLAAANRLIPPNVFYFEHDGLAAKYAVLSEADFYRLNGPETSNVSVWARFAQPSRLVWAADEAARERAIDAVSRAAPTLLAAAGQARGREAARLVAAGFLADLFGRAARRAAGRAGVGRRCRPRALQPLHGAALPRRSTREPTASWRWRRVEGKALSVAAAGQGERDLRRRRRTISRGRSTATPGPRFELKPWQRRHPLLAAISLLPRLLRSGAVR